MKKKIIITIIIGFILTILINNIIPKKEEYFLPLGDSLAMGYTFNNLKGYSYNDYIKDNHNYHYLDGYTNEYETTTSLLLKLENNYQEPTENLSIIQSIAKSSLITISIGMKEFSTIEDISTNNIEEYYNRLNKIIKFIRNYNNKKIIIIGTFYYNKSNIINEYIKKISTKYSLIYINIEDITKHQSYFFTPNNYELNFKGHLYIYQKISEHLNNT